MSFKDRYGTVKDSFELSKGGFGFFLHDTQSNDKVFECELTEGIYFGQVKTDWSAGDNYVTLHPMDHYEQDFSGVDTSTEIKAYLISESNGSHPTPHYCGLKEDDRVPFILLGDVSGTTTALVIAAPIVEKPPLYFGKVDSEFTTGSTITLDPCDVKGTDNGESNVTVYVKTDQTSYTVANSSSIAADTVLPYTIDASGDYYLLGPLITVMTNMQWDTSNYEWQKKTRDVILWGSNESSWTQIIDGTECDDTGGS